MRSLIGNIGKYHNKLAIVCGESDQMINIIGVDKQKHAIAKKNYIPGNKSENVITHEDKQYLYVKELDLLILLKPLKVLNWNNRNLTKIAILNELNQEQIGI